MEVSAATVCFITCVATPVHDVVGRPPVTVSPLEVSVVQEPEKDDFLQPGEREVRLYVSYAEANVVRTKLAQMLGDRATVSRLKSIAGGWAFTIQRSSELGGGDPNEERHHSDVANSS